MNAALLLAALHLAAPAASVRVGDLSVLELRAAPERAARASAALDLALADAACGPEDLRVTRGDTGGALVLCGAHILEVTPQDAEWEGRTVEATADRWAGALRDAFRQEKSRRYADELLRRATAGLVSSLLFLGSILLVRLAFRRARLRLLDRPEGSRGVAIGPLVLLATRAERGFLAGLLRVVSLLVYLALLYAFAVVLFRQIPRTRAWAASMVAPLGELARAVGAGALELLPRLAVAAVLLVAVRLALRATGRLFDQVRQGKLLAGRFLSPETAAPAELTARAVIVASGLFLATLLVPGAGVQALLGSFLLGGLAVAWGAAGLVANALAGVYALYGRPFRKGDRVQLGGQSGTVARVGLLHVRLEREAGGTALVPNRRVFEQGFALAGPGRRLAGEVVLASARGLDAAVGLIRHAAVEAGLKRDGGRVALREVRGGRLVFRVDWPLAGADDDEVRAGFLRALLEHGPGLEVEVVSALAEAPTAP